MISIKEQIVEQLDLLPEPILVQILNFVKVFKRTETSNGTAHMTESSLAPHDPLVGLYAGSPDLASCAEEILEQEITSTSGWTWKNN